MWQGQTVTVTASHSPQCDQPHTTLSDAWRATGVGERLHRRRLPEWDKPRRCHDGRGGRRLVPLRRIGGGALLLAPPGIHHCGTGHTGWLPGWDADNSAGAAPPSTYNVAGWCPASAEGVSGRDGGLLRQQ
jgi:hypothetical protein